MEMNNRNLSPFEQVVQHTEIIYVVLNSYGACCLQQRYWDKTL